MRRYITIRTQPVRSYWDEGEFEHSYPANSSSDTITVFERECELHQTGLLDEHGNALYALEERSPIGFIQNYLR